MKYDARVDTVTTRHTTDTIPGPLFPGFGTKKWFGTLFALANYTDLLENVSRVFRTGKEMRTITLLVNIKLNFFSF